MNLGGRDEPGPAAGARAAVSSESASRLTAYSSKQARTSFGRKRLSWAKSRSADPSLSPRCDESSIIRFPVRAWIIHARSANANK